MPNSNMVIFKGKKNGITILLDEKSDFEDIKTILNAKVTDAKKFFGGGKTSITFQGRLLSEEEETELLAIIAEKANLNISFVSEDVFKGVETTSAGDKQSEPVLPAYTPKLYLPEHITKFHGGSLRSGQAIRFSGSVVIMGDVNPGAEVIAEGNIIILGAAKGLVHAGCTGNTDCFVSAVTMIPTQLRIAELITYIPKDMLKKNKLRPNPCYAYVNKGQIYIAPLVNS